MGQRCLSVGNNKWGNSDGITLGRCFLVISNAYTLSAPLHLLLGGTVGSRKEMKLLSLFLSLPSPRLHPSDHPRTAAVDQAAAGCEHSVLFSCGTTLFASVVLLRAAHGAISLSFPFVSTSGAGLFPNIQNMKHLTAPQGSSLEMLNMNAFR